MRQGKVSRAQAICSSFSDRVTVQVLYTRTPPFFNSRTACNTATTLNPQVAASPGTSSVFVLNNLKETNAVAATRHEMNEMRDPPPLIEKMTD